MALPERDEVFLQSTFPNWEILPNDSEQLLVIHDYAFPQGRYQPGCVDLLIRIPAHYPMANPDMFFIQQAVAKSDGTAPQSVSQTTINGSGWFQWSRHYQQGTWRPGIDGLQTYFRAIRTELEKGK